MSSCIKEEHDLVTHLNFPSQESATMAPRIGGQVAESHKSVVDGCGQVFIPLQEVLKVQHQHSCGQAGKRGLLI